jgi:cytochrome c-type biogenesis protein CcmH/NrfF
VSNSATAKIAKDLCGVPPRNRTIVAWIVPLVVVILSTVFYVLRLLSRSVLGQSIDAGDIVLGASVVSHTRAIERDELGLSNFES